MIATLLGGLGLFLLGMIVMTDGLNGLTGHRMRRTLLRFTRSPTSGVVTGALTTAVLQSSSATTVAAVGFVSAGLLTFSQALGIVFGANIGTTATGWLVALLGFKLQLAELFMPVIFLGAVCHLFGRGRIAAIGLAAAGFGLILVSVAMLQHGMADIDRLLPINELGTDTLGGRLKLVGLGLVFTVATQSSSAGVAVALTALHGGVISFPQAAALVIGMDVGTTVTAALATLGAPLDAKRTGYSHVVYNLFTATLALSLVTPYLMVWEWLAPQWLATEAEFGLVGFHTLFNALGIVAVLPFTNRFARMMEWLVPSRHCRDAEPLDQRLLSDPIAARAVAARRVRGLYLSLLTRVTELLTRDPRDSSELQRIESALDRVTRFVDDIPPAVQTPGQMEGVTALVHCLDHLHRLHERCQEEPDRAAAARESTELAAQAGRVRRHAVLVMAALNDNRWSGLDRTTETLAGELAALELTTRAGIAGRVASGELDWSEANALLAGVRWLKRVSSHMAGIERHLATAILS